MKVTLVLNLLKRCKDKIYMTLAILCNIGQTQVQILAFLIAQNKASQSAG